MEGDNMNIKHLIWIIPLIMIISFLLGVFFYAFLQLDALDFWTMRTVECYEELYNISPIFEIEHYQY